MAAPTIYRSTDTSAPVLNGSAGSLVTVLDACLVNGYGSKAAAGWTKAFSATNKASYRQGAASAADFYLDIDDSGAGGATTQEANARGYEAMTAVGTGTNPFPTAAQIASPGMFIRKSAATGATARAWLIAADDMTVHMFLLSGDSAGLYQAFSFGEIYSFKAADAFKVAALGANITGANISAGLNVASMSVNAGSATAGVYLARGQAGTGTSAPHALLGIGTTWSTPANGPNLPDSNIYISRLFLGENGTNGIHGYLRGVYQMVTASGLTDGDTFSGAAGSDFAGRTFLILNHLRSGTYLAIETTAWDTST